MVADALLFVGGEKVYDLVPSVTKGRVSHLLLLQRKAPGVFLSFGGGGEGWSATFSWGGEAERLGGGGFVKIMPIVSCLDWLTCLCLFIKIGTIPKGYEVSLRGLTLT